MSLNVGPTPYHFKLRVFIYSIHDLTIGSNLIQRRPYFIQLFGKQINCFLLTPTTMPFIFRIMRLKFSIIQAVSFEKHLTDFSFFAQSPSIFSWEVQHYKKNIITCLLQFMLTSYPIADLKSSGFGVHVFFGLSYIPEYNSFL